VRYEFDYQYSDDLVRAGVKRALIQQTGWKAAGWGAVVLAFVVALCMSDIGEYWCGLAQGAVLLTVMLFVMTYMSASERALRFARKLDTRKVRCELTEATLTVESALAMSTVHWPVVEAVVRGPDVWLFYLSRDQLFIVPADKLAGEAGAFVEGRVTAAGGRML